MKAKGFLTQAEELVKQEVHGFYQQTTPVAELAARLSADCIWIGAGRQEFFPDLADAKKYFLNQENAQAVPYFEIDDEAYHATLLAPHVALVCGTYHLYIKTMEPPIDEQQRCTFVIGEKEDGVLEIRHIHISNPWHLMRGTELFPHAVFAENGEELAKQLAKEKRLEKVQLSAQQGKILSFLSLGLTYEEIAGKMGISARTVRYHVEQILNKFYVNNRQELLLRYIQLLLEKENKT